MSNTAMFFNVMQISIHKNNILELSQECQQIPY